MIDIEITDIKLIDLLDSIADELFSELKLGFFKAPQSGVFGTRISIRSYLYIDRNEIAHNNIFNITKAKNILKKRVKNALLELKNLVQDSLDKLEKL